MTLAEDFDSGEFEWSLFQAEGDRTWLEANGSMRGLIVPPNEAEAWQGREYAPNMSVWLIEREGVFYMPVQVAIAIGDAIPGEWLCAAIPAEVAVLFG